MGGVAVSGRGQSRRGRKGRVFLRLGSGSVVASRGGLTPSPDLFRKFQVCDTVLNFLVFFFVA